MKVINNCPYVVLSFDLWMSVKNEDIFNIRPSFRGAKKGHHHFGTPRTKGTNAKNLSDYIINIITNFNLEKKC